MTVRQAAPTPARALLVWPGEVAMAKPDLNQEGIGAPGIAPWRPGEIE